MPEIKIDSSDGEEALGRIDERLAELHAASQANIPDPTGLDELVPIMTSAFSIMTASRLAGFNEQQSFEMAKAAFLTLMRLSVEQQ